jgi:hypothetical protein
MLEPQQVGQLADEIVLVLGQPAVGVGHPPHRLHDLDAVVERGVAADEMRQREVIDGLGADLGGGLDQLLRHRVVESEGALEIGEQVLVLFARQDAVGVADVEEHRGRGQP